MHCNGDIRKHPRESEILYFFKKFLRLAMQLKAHIIVYVLLKKVLSSLTSFKIYVAFEREAQIK
jgi:hypothetical protein